MLKLRRFIPSQSISLRPTSSRIVFFSLLLMIIVTVIENFMSNGYTMPVIFILFVAILIGVFWGIFEKESSNGKLVGYLTFFNDRIEIDDKCYYWDNVQNFNFSLGRVEGEDLKPHGTISYIGPRYSQGVDNYIKFDSYGERVVSYFQLSSYQEKFTFNNIIKNQFLKGNISLESTYNGLGLEYEEIQHLKKMKINAPLNEEKGTSK